MQVQTSPSNPLLHCTPTPQGTLLCEQVSKEEAKSLTVLEAGKQAQDSLQQNNGIKRGLLPAGKGLLAGGAAGAVTGSALAATLSHNMVGVFGDYTVGGAARVGAVIGGVLGAGAGAVSANFIDNKAVNVAIGAVVGGVASGAVGAGWLIGGLAGGAGALAGTMMIEKK